MNKWLIVVLIIALVMIYIFRTGYLVPNDDSIYINFANQIQAHTFNPTNSAFSYGWVFPYFVWLSAELFGSTFYGFTILCTTVEYLSLIVLTYILANKFFKNSNYSVLAAFFIAIFPFLIQITTRVFNDVLLGVMATLAMIFFLSDKKYDWLLAGLMAGLMISIKLIGVAFIIPFGLYALFSNKRYYVILGIIIGFAIYMLPFAIIAHNPLYSIEGYGKFQSSLSPSNFNINRLTLEESAGLWMSAPIGNARYMDFSLGLLFWLAVIGTLLGFIFKKDKIIYFSILFWGYVLYIHFGTITLSTYSFQTVVSRNFCLIAAPFAILIAYAVMVLHRMAYDYDKKWAIILLIALVILTIASLWTTYSTIYYFNIIIRTHNYVLFHKLIGM